MKEPLEAFPYRAPTKEIYTKYSSIFNIKEPLPNRLFKTIFDKIVAASLLLFALPIFFILKIAYVIEGLLIPENSGPLFFYYFAVSQGQIFKKYKIRLIKCKCIDFEAAKKNEWIAYSSEWNPKCRTYVGEFVKKYYLDELPQFYSILKGEMSIVGPRPISVLHYDRDCSQGNVTRKILKGGLLGLGHINKGTSEMGNPVYEYEYISEYLKRSSFRLLLLDLWIIYKGVKLIFKGGGH